MKPELRDGIGSALRRALARFYACYSDETSATKLALSPLQCIVLDWIEREESCSLSFLGNALDIDKSTCSEMVKRLVNSGLVAAEKYPGDGRRSSISITPEGSKRLRVSRQQYRQAEARFVGTLRTKGFMEILEKLGQ